MYILVFYHLFQFLKVITALYNLLFKRGEKLLTLLSLKLKRKEGMGGFSMSVVNKTKVIEYVCFSTIYFLQLSFHNL